MPDSPSLVGHTISQDPLIDELGGDGMLSRRRNPPWAVAS